MLKKIAVAAALCASASFAGWDLFPVLEDHRGEFLVGTGFLVQGSGKAVLPGLGVRYTLAPNFEMSVMGQAFFVVSEGDGEYLYDPVVSMRYQFTPNMNVVLDMHIPVGSEELNDDGFGFGFGIQYSRNTGVVNFGSQLGLAVYTEGDDGFTPPFELDLAGETDFLTGSAVTPFIGVSLAVMLGEYTYEGENVSRFLFGEDVSGKVMVKPSFGVKFAVSPKSHFDLGVSFVTGDEVLVGSETPVTFGAFFHIGF